MGGRVGWGGPTPRLWGEVNLLFYCHIWIHGGKQEIRRSFPAVMKLLRDLARRDNVFGELFG